MSRTRRRLIPLATAIGLAVLATGCSPMVDLRGNRAEDDSLRTIQVGTTTKQEVQRILGSPSNVSSFDPNTWFYIAKREETLAFFKPDIRWQRVVRIQFADDGTVSDVRRLGLQDARNVATVDRTTPTRGSEPGFFRSLWETFTTNRVNRKKKSNFDF